MKTAVEWLVEELWICKKTKSNWKILENKAKEMEKKQIMSSWHNGLANQTEFFNDHTGTIIRANCAEQYYNETFKSE
jgi:hypothetical protein